MSDLISRQAAIDALRKALYEYEDKTEKQFIESDDLDIEDWIKHRIFVQNMSVIDRKTIMELPSAQRWIPVTERLPEVNIDVLICNDDGIMHTAVMKAENIYETEFKTWHIKYCLYDYDVWDEGENGKIVAWMPLPEPWKGEEDG